MDPVELKYKNLADSILDSSGAPPDVIVTSNRQIFEHDVLEHVDGQWGSGAQRIVSRAWKRGETLTILVSTWGRLVGPHIALRLQLLDGEPSILQSAGVRHLRNHTRFEDAETCRITSGSIEVSRAGMSGSSAGVRCLRLDLHANGTTGNDIGSIRGVVYIPEPEILQ